MMLFSMDVGCNQGPPRDSGERLHSSLARVCIQHHGKWQVASSLRFMSEGNHVRHHPSCPSFYPSCPSSSSVSVMAVIIRHGRHRPSSSVIVRHCPSSFVMVRHHPSSLMTDPSWSVMVRHGPSWSVINRHDVIAIQNR